MATVYVVTAGSGDSYRIERVYLDGERAYRFAQDYNGIAPVEPVQVEEWESGAPARWLRRPVLAGGVVGADAGRKRRSALRHTDEGDRFDDFAIRQEWWTGEALPRGHGGAPGTGRGAEDRGGRPVQGEGGGTVLGHDHPGPRRAGRSPRK